MPKALAKPPAQPALTEKQQKAVARKPVKVFSSKEQDSFNAEADALASELGWSGPDENVLHDVAVRDARRYLRKVFHEVHQSALTEERDTPEAAAVCEHLGVDDPAEVELVAKAIKAAYDRECADAPANPTSLPGDPKIGNMRANITASASAALGKLAEGESKARG